MCLYGLQPKGSLKKDIDRFSSWQEVPTGFLLQPHTSELSVALSAPGTCMTFQSDIFCQYVNHFDALDVTANDFK